MTISQFPLPEGGIPTGDTAGRPASPVIGDVYYNGELGILEIYEGTNWIPCSAPPAPPTVSSAVDVGTGRSFGSAQATVTLAASPGGGAPITFQAVGNLSGTEYFSASTTATTITLSVGNAGTYSIGGRASNNFGTSVTGDSTSVALTTVPQAPTIGTATTSSTTSDITVNWTLNANGGKNLTSITITPYLNGTTAQTATTAATTTAQSATVSGLTQGSSYTFKVKTTNANGDSVESSASNSITVPLFVEYLVIAGGGSGGSPGGGGGAGGYRTGNLTFTKSTNYTVTVGSGAASQTGSRGLDGGTSTFASINATGGGRGAGNTAGSSAGGSGGGGSRDGTYAGSLGNAGNYTPAEGNSGGSSTVGSYRGGAGGGGAGAAGSPGTGDGTAAGEAGGNGGDGAASSITGSSVTRGGGGGGGNEQANSNSAGAGGSGGGGAGGKASAAGTAGQANTGGGGGGTGGSGSASGAGGSGVVILRWLTSSASITVGAGLTADSTGTDGSYSYKRFTAGTGNVSFS
jgi:hypothetical protein